MKNVDLVRPPDLRELLEHQRPPCVSLYMPTHRKSDQKRQDPLRLKNLLRQAEEQLVASGERAASAHKLLEPLAGLIQQYTFWKYQSEGLALFLSEAALEFYHLPFPFDELVVTGEHFHFNPLLPLLAEDGLFYIIMLSQHSVRLFQANRFAVGEIGLESLIPEEIQRMKLHHDLERHLDFHSGTPIQRRPAKHLPNYFGQGAHCDCRKQDILQFFEKVDWAVLGMLRQDHRPLVPAGVDYVVDIYRRASHYPYLIDQEITGNLEGAGEKELQRLAWQLVEPLFQRGREQTKQAYRDLAGTMRTDNQLNRILPAAEQGLIQALFVSLRASPDQETLGLAALFTLIHKGAVYAVAPEEMPGGGTVNAIYRF